MSTQQHMAVIATLTRERDEARAEAARLSERLRAFTEWASTWRHAMVIRAIGADEAWRQFEEAHNHGCAALTSTSATDWLRERDAATRDAALEEAYRAIVAAFEEDEDVAAVDVVRALKRGGR
jgi:hypothetical protein